MNTRNRLAEMARRVRALLWLSVKTFFRIDGLQWAGAFSFNAFFSLFPVMLLVVTVASFFVDQNRAGNEVIAYIESYVPIKGEMQSYIFGAIAGVIKVREQAGAVALLILIWAALQCFTTLISAANRAWDTAVSNWWRLPMKSLLLLGITTVAILLGMALPVLARLAEVWVAQVLDVHSWVYALGRFVIPLLVMFFGLSLFYRLAPHRPTRFAEVWVAALCATALLEAAQRLFVIYLTHFATLNAVYGAFGGIMALLLWIYISGCIFIFGACLCAAQSYGRAPPRKQ